MSIINTACESAVKATTQVNGKGQNSTPRHATTLWPILAKIGMGDNVVYFTRHAKFYCAPVRGVCSPYTWFSVPSEVTSFNAFWVLATRYSLHP